MKILRSGNGIFTGCLLRVLLKRKSLTQSALDIKYGLLPGKGKNTPLLIKWLHTRVQILVKEMLHKIQVFLNMYVYIHATQTFRTSKFLTLSTHTFSTRDKIHGNRYYPLGSYPFHLDDIS